jgi:hypothetical protein
MHRTWNCQFQIVPKIVELAICLYFLKGLRIRQHQVDRQGARRVRREAKADEIRAAMKNGIAVSRKERKPVFCVRFTHEQIDIESGTRVGKQVDGIAAHEERIESLGARARGQSDAVGVGHRTELRSVWEQVEKNLNIGDQKSEIRDQTAGGGDGMRNGTGSDQGRNHLASRVQLTI